jgi:transposase InsO family protein
MNARQLQGASRRKGIRTTVRDRDARPAPDLVDRKFVADAPNKLWVADITYVPTYAGFLFLAVVLDAFSWRVVGWATSSTMKTQLVLDALQYGDPSTSTNRRRSSLRPGNAVYLNRVWITLPRGEHPSVDGIGGGLLR